MAPPPCRFCKHQGVPAGGLAQLLLVLVVVALVALPGGAAQQQPQDGGNGVVIPDNVDEACRSGPSLQMDLLSCAESQLEKDFQSRCCELLKSEAPFLGECVCGVLNVIKGRGINVNNVCNTTGIEKPCEDKAEAARIAQEKKAEGERAAKEREDNLSNLDPCERFFERFAGGDTSKITPEDARRCFQTIRTCAASCQKQ